LKDPVRNQRRRYYGS